MRPSCSSSATCAVELACLVQLTTLLVNAYVYLEETYTWINLMFDYSKVLEYARTDSTPISWWHFMSVAFAAHGFPLALFPFCFGTGGSLLCLELIYDLKISG